MERTYIQKSERNAAAIILFLAACLAALLTGIMCWRVDAAVQAVREAYPRLMITLDAKCCGFMYWPTVTAMRIRR